MSKKTNVEKLQPYQLAAIRQRIGAASETDTSQDDEINQMLPLDLARAYAGWHLGDEGWADILIGIYDAARK